MNKKSIILASASPRRQEILRSLNIEFTTVVTDVNETVTDCVTPQEFVRIVAERKGRAARKIITNDELQMMNCGILIISADTIVVIDNKILGKPRDKQDAFGMLSLLQGRTHRVYTGIYLIDISDGECKEFFNTECSDVTFKPLNEKEIRQYVESGEPMDKAGAYGIQGLGGNFVVSYTGELNNIIGLPTDWLIKKVKAL